MATSSTHAPVYRGDETSSSLERRNRTCSVPPVGAWKAAFSRSNAGKLGFFPERLRAFRHVWLLRSQSHGAEFQFTPPSVDHSTLRKSKPGSVSRLFWKLTYPQPPGFVSTGEVSVYVVWSTYGKTWKLVLEVAPGLPRFHPVARFVLAV